MDVTVDEMRAAVRDPNVTILDVLSREAYAAAHIPRAINVPFGDLREAAAVELPDTSRRIVAYCGGPT
jgi:rhodanese-related sulfurtransferase